MKVSNKVLVDGTSKQHSFDEKFHVRFAHASRKNTALSCTVVKAMLTVQYNSFMVYSRGMAKRLLSEGAVIGALPGSIPGRRLS